MKLFLEMYIQVMETISTFIAFHRVTFCVQNRIDVNTEEVGN